MDEGHKETDKRLAELESKLVKSYEDAAADLQKKIDKYLRQFEKEDTEKRALYDSGELSHDEYMSWHC